MSNTRIRKVKFLQGMAQTLAKNQGLNPSDLVVLTVSIEKVVGDPVSFLLSKVHSSDKTQTPTPKAKVKIE